MKYLLLVIFLIWSNQIYSQLEINGSYSYAQQGNTKGLGFNVAYELPFVGSRWGVKPQLAYKCNCNYYDFTETEFINRRVELHSTVNYEALVTRTYQLVPNVGVNLRYSYWSAEMVDPLNQLPIRNYVSSVRAEPFFVSSQEGFEFTEVEHLTFGFTAQLQNKFKLSEIIDLNITPFIEFDYDREQTVGGGYFGITYNR